jgi:hypothetical protein
LYARTQGLSLNANLQANMSPLIERQFVLLN